MPAFSFSTGPSIFAQFRRPTAFMFPIAALAMAFTSFASAVTLPASPLTFDTTYAPPNGSTIAVNSGGDFQAALNNANPGDTIVLQAGATFTGPFTLPNKPGAGWIYIQSSKYASLPSPGNRVGASDAANMATIVAPSFSPAIVTVNGSHHFRFVGVEFVNAPNVYTYNLVQLDNGDTSVSTLANNITFDRCYFFADATAIGVRRGLLANAAYVAVVDSDFDGFREVGADSNAILAYNTSGPIKIVNNYLVGAGENVMFGGGGDSANAALVPADIEIRGNTFFKPLSWIGSNWTVKNLLEFKSALRALVTGNIFQNNWAAAQVGFSLLITPRNQNGTAPWSATQDIAITNNLMTNLGSGINILGTDYNHTSQQTQRVLIKNNVISVNGLNGASGWAFEVNGNASDVTIDHNTAFDTNAYFYAAGLPLTQNFTFTNNIVAKGTYGFIGAGTGDGSGTLSAFFANPTFAANAVIGDSASAYPTGNFFPATPQAVNFVDYANGNFALAGSSPYKGKGTDGLDIGADTSAVPTIAGGPIVAAAPVTPAQPAPPSPPSNVQVN